MFALPVPAVVFKTVAAALPVGDLPRPRHRGSWSPVERRLEQTLPAPRGRHLARPIGWAAVEVKR